MKRKTLILLLLILPFLAFSQADFKKEKRIYMLDITKSMWGLAGSSFNVFDKVKNDLYKGIEDIEDEETIITVIPYQATKTFAILDSWTFKSGDKVAFNNMKAKIDSYTMNNVPQGYTDIYSALEKAKDQIDINRTNYIFLLTDGGHEPLVGNQDHTRVRFSDEDLRKSFGSWCDYSFGKSTYLFYIRLTDQAQDKTIEEILKKQCNAFIKDGTSVNIAFIKPATNSVRMNLHDETTKIEIPFNANDWENLKGAVELNINLESNSIFELANTSVKLKDEKIELVLKPKDSFANLKSQLPENNTLKLEIASGRDDLFIVEPVVNLDVRNKKERVLKLNFSK